jgi:hypothetical protein
MSASCAAHTPCVTVSLTVDRHEVPAKRGARDSRATARERGLDFLSNDAVTATPAAVADRVGAACGGCVEEEETVCALDDTPSSATSSSSSELETWCRRRSRRPAAWGARGAGRQIELRARCPQRGFGTRFFRDFRS